MNPDYMVHVSEEVEAEGEEVNLARWFPSPTQPTRQEIPEHVLTHLRLRERGTCCADCFN